MKCLIWGANKSGMWFQEFVESLADAGCEVDMQDWMID